MKKWLALVVGLVLVWIHNVLYAPLTSDSAVLQLEDSDISYGVAANIATGAGYTVFLYYVGMALLIYSTWLFLKASLLTLKQLKEDLNKW